ncbi:nuclear transport factor 2 family protein [Nocardioides sp. zg-536]|uniref:Nuclear transport factor 2 family protein n=1 Tax=Nocardioides faecalis TaxID=2803858 RepID=A0A938Y3L5_9ACTN|nr:nuclear transport factor 2 family protein [Nocardioides faecalis]MBM9458615.1 nuclear transport factor 2 family protein [Nocardioides faecalis]MBS4752947.1 nuclear transport factor 2 family protein [Nocardioides faecalis]QVI58614.1 nuclear transport factor 2 family protein [Nocardioides faecalis]
MTPSPLDDITAISRLKYRYLRTLDTKQWDEFADCFAPDATADYNGLAFEDPAALVDYMRTNMGPGVLTMHHVHHPEIDVDAEAPDRASAQWYLHDKVIVDEFRFALEGGAIYTDRYVRTEQGWRIQHTGYRRTYELTWSLDDPAGIKVSGPGAHTHV